MKEIKIKKEFKNLIRPLLRSEYLQLEQNIISDGCRDPIILWHGYIIDGHNRFEICTKHNIEYKTTEMEFGSEAEVIAWICSNQLGRRNISEETRKFLIGMQYETEKMISVMNAQGKNQYSSKDEEPAVISPSRHKTAQRIASEINLCAGTVKKYAEYTRALETIGEKEPDLVTKLLSGKYKISHRETLELAKKKLEELQVINRRMNRNQSSFSPYSKNRPLIRNNTTDESVGPTVKNMPTFDPDAEVTELTLTMPSWIGSIKRTQTNANLSIISEKARGKLVSTMENLIETAYDLLTKIEEAK